MPVFHEATDLYRRIGARREEGVVASNVASAYLIIPALRDLDQAQHWYQTALDFIADHDDIARPKMIGQLGSVAYRRFLDARTGGQPADVLAQHLTTAANYYQQALDLTPADHASNRGIIHNQLGVIYDDAGQIDTALPHYQQAIRHHEQSGDTYRAAQTRFNVALALANAGRTRDARHYAHAALRDYQTLTPSPTNDIAKTQQLINQLQE